MNETLIITCPKCSTNNRVLIDPEKQAVCGNCKTPLESPKTPTIVTDANFAEEVGKSPMPVLVDFWAAWCGPCRMIAPIIDSLAKEISGKVKIGKLDVDQNQGTAARFNVQSIPTMIIFKDGKEADRIVGGQSKEAILRRLQPFI